MSDSFLFSVQNGFRVKEPFALRRESHYPKEENKMAQAGEWGFGKDWTLKVKNP